MQKIFIRLLTWGVAYNQIGNVYGSYFDDAIINDYPAMVYGLAGNDQITNIGSFIYADADEGNDILINYAANAHVYLYGGGGNDYLANSGNSQATLYGGFETSGTDNDILVGNPYYPDIFTRYVHRFDEC